MQNQIDLSKDIIKLIMERIPDIRAASCVAREWALIAAELPDLARWRLITRQSAVGNAERAYIQHALPKMVDRIDLVQSVLYGNLELVRHIAPRSTPEARSDCLVHAASIGHLEIVQCLVSVTNSSDYKAGLIAAIIGGYFDVVRCLAPICANLDTAVAKAAYCNRLEMVQYLMALGGSIHRRDSYVVHHAAVRGNEAMVRCLVTDRVPPSQRAEMETVIRAATYGGYTNIVRYLESLL